MEWLFGNISSGWFFFYTFRWAVWVVGFRYILHYIKIYIDIEYKKNSLKTSLARLVWQVLDLFLGNFIYLFFFFKENFFGINNKYFLITLFTCVPIQNIMFISYHAPYIFIKKIMTNRYLIYIIYWINILCGLIFNFVFNVSVTQNQLRQNWLWLITSTNFFFFLI